MCALAFVMPLHKRATVIVIWLLGVSWLIRLLVEWIVYGTLAERFRCMIKNIGWIGIMVFFGLVALYLLGILWTENLDEVKFELEKKTSLLAFPLILFTMNWIFRKESVRDYILVSFLLGVITGSLLCLGNAMSHFFYSGDLSVFFYDQFSYLLHPGYFALYNVFALAIMLVYGSLLSRSSLSRRLHLFWIPVIFLGLMVFLLASKAGIISMVILFVLFFFDQVLIRKSYRYALQVIGLAVFIMVMGYIFMTGSVTRMASMDKLTKWNEEVDTLRIADGVQIRKLMWAISFEQFTDAPLLGTGTGDYYKDISARIQKKNLIHTVGGIKNAHNQYLQTLATTGFFSFLFLLLWLGYPFMVALKRRDFLYGSFLIVVAVNLLVESMLETQAGIVFIAFFNTFLFADLTTEKHPAASPPAGGSAARA